jgi:photosystem II stability/assembly factor-like uncharacterized protein
MKTAQILLLISMLVYAILLGTALPQGISWKQTGGPAGGNINSLGRTTGGSLIAVSAGGIYKSTNSGLNWKKGNYSLQNSTTEIITTPSGYTVFANDKNVFRSTDNGETWSVTGVTSANVGHIAVNDYGVIFLSADDKLYVSDNNGASWINSNEPKSFNFIYGIAVNGKDIFISANNGIYKSSDYGKYWTNISGNLPSGVCYSIFYNGNKIYAGKYRGIYSTSDNGNTWELCTSDFKEQAVGFAADSSGSIYASTGDALLMSADGGKLWSKIKEFTFPAGVPGSLVFMKDGTAFAAGYNSVLKFTGNFTSIEELSDGMINTVIYDIGVTSKNKVIAIGDFDLFATSDNGDTWKPLDAKSVFGVYPNHRLGIDKKDNIYIGYGSGYGKSTDGGVTWEKHLTGSGSGFKSFAFGNNGILFALGNAGVYRSVNDGFTWQQVESFPIDINDSKIITDRYGYIYYRVQGGIYRSTDDGNTWNRISSDEQTGITDFLITRKGYFVTGTTTGMYLSFNSGNSWQKVNVGKYNQSYVYTLFEAPNGSLITTTTYGLFISVNDGLAWNFTDDAETRGFVATYFMTDKNGYLYAGSGGKGVFRTQEPFLKITAPDAVVLPGSQKVYLSWNRNRSSVFKEYKIYGSYGHYPVSLIYTSGSISDTSAVISGLINGAPYYIVVSAVDNEGNETFSDEYAVIPGEAPAAPRLIYAANNAVNVPVPATLSWRKSSGALTYTLQVSQDSSFTNNVINYSGITDTIKQADSLLYLIKYFWRVRGNAAVETGKWSDVWKFTTAARPPEVPALNTPANMAVNIPVVQVFKWNKAERGTGYQLQVSEDSAFSRLVINDSSLTDTIYQGKLINNKKYYWRVLSFNAGGKSAWSDIWTFTTVPEKPGSFAAVYPAAGEENVRPGFKFIWRKSERGDKYSLQIAQDSLFTMPVINDSTITDTVFTAPLLMYSKTYYWRVKAVNTGGETGWVTQHFTTGKEMPGVPALLTPQNNSTKQQKQMTVAWKRAVDADYYILQLYTDSLLTKSFFSDSSLTDTVKQVASLKSGTRYYWYIEGINYAHKGEKSPVWNFTTLLEAPSLKAENAGIQKNKLIVGNNSDTEPTYIIERKQAGDNNFSILDTLKAGKTEYTDTSALPAVKYMYRVKAYTQYAASDYSSTAEVTTITGIGGENGIPDHYAISQNFPNPFNPSTTINYSVPYESNVKIIIYNSLGERVTEINNGIKPAGYYSIVFNAGGLSSGVYFCSIKAESTDGKNNFNSIRKMLLIK